MAIVMTRDVFKEGLKEARKVHSPDEDGDMLLYMYDDGSMEWRPRLLETAGNIIWHRAVGAFSDRISWDVLETELSQALSTSTAGAQQFRFR